VSGRRGSGSFGSGRTAGYAMGEERTSPWLEAIAGIRQGGDIAARESCSVVKPNNLILSVCLGGGVSGIIFI